MPFGCYTEHLSSTRITSARITTWECLHLARQELREADRHLTQALERSPYDAVALANFARLRLRQSRPGDAESYVRKSLEIRPDHPQTLELWEQIRGATAPQ